MKKIFNVLIQGLLSILSVPLRPHGKRIVLLTTLFMQLTNLQNYNKDKMLELNRSLHLARTEDALEFPCILNRAVWGSGLPAIDKINEEESKASYIVSITPLWLRYNHEQMMDDVKKVLQNTGVSQHAVAA